MDVFTYIKTDKRIILFANICWDERASHELGRGRCPKRRKEKTCKELLVRSFFPNRDMRSQYRFWDFFIDRLEICFRGSTVERFKHQQGVITIMTVAIFSDFLASVFCWWYLPYDPWKRILLEVVLSSWHFVTLWAWDYVNLLSKVWSRTRRTSC